MIRLLFFMLYVVLVFNVIRWYKLICKVFVILFDVLMYINLVNILNVVNEIDVVNLNLFVISCCRYWFWVRGLVWFVLYLVNCL